MKITDEFFDSLSIDSTVFPSADDLYYYAKETRKALLTTRAEVERLREALSELLDCHDEDIGMDEYDDSESVGSESGPDGGSPMVDMKLTFGVLRRARHALEKGER